MANLYVNWKYETAFPCKITAAKSARRLQLAGQALEAAKPKVHGVLFDLRKSPKAHKGRASFSGPAWSSPS